MQCAGGFFLCDRGHTVLFYDGNWEEELRPYLSSLVWQNCGMGAVAGGTGVLLWSHFTAYAFFLCAFAAVAFITAAGLHVRHRKAYVMSAYTPFASLLIWFILGCVAAAYLDLMLNGGEGTGRENFMPITGTIVGAVLIPVWIVATRAYFSTRRYAGRFFRDGQDGLGS